VVPRERDTAWGDVDSGDAKVLGERLRGLAARAAPEFEHRRAAGQRLDYTSSIASPLLDVDRRGPLGVTLGDAVVAICDESFRIVHSSALRLALCNGKYTELNGITFTPNCLLHLFPVWRLAPDGLEAWNQIVERARGRPEVPQAVESDAVRAPLRGGRRRPRSGSANEVNVAGELIPLWIKIVYTLSLGVLVPV
jgi:hypothetical protein